MQIFLLSRRSTASGNGIGSAPTVVRYKRARGARNAFARDAGRSAVFSDEVGATAVRLAREAVARALGEGSPSAPVRAAPGVFRERRGVFVSWYVQAGHRLRGCIGFPEPVLPLGTGLREAAVAAALDDPRFPPVSARELGGLVAEVSLLTPLVALAPEERPRGVRVGRDGLVVEARRMRGLLLPQVATEQGWTAEQFLDGTCEKAGVARGAWRSPEVGVFRFEAEVFRERSPAGEVVRVRLPS